MPVGLKTYYQCAKPVPDAVLYLFEELPHCRHGSPTATAALSQFATEVAVNEPLETDELCLQANKESIIQGPLKRYPPVSGTDQAQ